MTTSSSDYSGSGNELELRGTDTTNSGLDIIAFMLSTVDIKAETYDYGITLAATDAGTLAGLIDSGTLTLQIDNQTQSSTHPGWFWTDTTYYALDDNLYVIKKTDENFSTTAVQASNDYSVTITWDYGTDETDGYKVYFNNDVYLCEKSSITIDELAPGDFIYMVEAYQENGSSKECQQTSGLGKITVQDAVGPTGGKLTASYDSKLAIVTLTVSGYTDDYGTVDSYTFYQDGVEMKDQTCTKGSDGTVTKSIQLAKDHEYLKLSYSVVAYDNLKNAGDEASVEVTFPDTTAPEAPDGLAAAQATDSYEMTLTWNVPKDNGTIASYLVYLDTVDSTKAVTVKTNKLTQTIEEMGEHSFKVIALDEAGNKSAASAVCKFTVADVTVPTLEVVTCVQEDNTLVVTASGVSDNSGQIVGGVLKLNGETLTLTPAIDLAAGTVIYTYHLGQDECGDFTFSVCVQDEAGLKSEEKSVTYTIEDTVSPDAPTGLAAARTDVNTATLTWDVPSDNSGSIDHYEVYLDGVAVTQLAYTNSIVLSDVVKSHAFAVVAYDKTGNASEKSAAVEFYIDDTTAPTVGTVTAVVTELGGREYTITADGFSDDGSVISQYIFYVNGDDINLAYTSTTQGTATATYTVADDYAGTITFGVRAVDDTGNMSEMVTNSYTIEDIYAPDAPCNLSAEVSESGGVKFIWDAVTDNSGGTVTYYVYLDGSTTPTRTTSTSLEVSKLSGGIHSFCVQAIDASANMGVKSETYEVYVPDVTAPTKGKLSAVLSSDKKTITLTASGFSDDSGSIESYVFYADDAELDWAYEVDKSGNIVATQTVPEELVGEVVFGVCAVDSTGNRCDMVTKKLKVTDTYAPDAPTGLSGVRSDTSTALLSWNVPYDNSGAVKSYLVYIDGDTKGKTVSTNSYTLKSVVGEHTYSVKAVDAAGNTSAASETCTFYVEDTTAPTGSSLSAKLSSDGRQVNLSLKEFKDDSGEIAQYDFFLDNVLLDVEASSDGNGNIVATYDLPEETLGSLTFAVQARDASDNVSKQSTAKVTVKDIVAPETPVNLCAEAGGTAGTAVLSWDAPYDNSGKVKYYYVYVDGAEKGQKTTGNSYEQKNLGGGIHTYYVVAYDEAGNASGASASYQFTIADTTAPSGGKLSAQLDGTGKSLVLKVSGYSDDSGTIARYVFYINDEEVLTRYASTESIEAFTLNYELADTDIGTVKVGVMAVDAAGNESKQSTASVKVTDKVAPDAATGLQATVSGTDSAILAWDVPYDNSGSIKSYKVFLDGSESGKSVTKNSYTASDIVGDHSFYVVAYDAAGNASAASAVCDFYIDDTTAPTAGRLTAKLSEDGKTLTLTSTAFSDNSGLVSQYYFYQDGVEINQSYTVSKSGEVTAEYAVSEELLGTVSFGISAADLSGNMSKTASVNVKFSDTKAPEAPTNLEYEMTSSDTALLSWSAPYDNSGSIKSYKIYLDGSEKGESVTQNSYTAKKLTGGEHSFQVVAYDSTGNASAASESCVFSVDDTTAPSAGKISASLLKGNNTVTLTVRSFSDDSGVISEYLFYINGKETDIPYYTDTTGDIIGEVTLGSEFVGDVDFSVRAIDAAGNQSKMVSTTLKVDDGAAPEAPDNLSAEIDGSNAILTWDAPYDNSGSVKSYMVYVDGSRTGQKTTDSSLTLKGLVGSHGYTVVAYDAAGNASAQSAECGFYIEDTTAPTGGKLQAVVASDMKTVTLTAESFTDDSDVIDDYWFYANDTLLALEWSEDSDGTITASYDVPDTLLGKVTFGVKAVDAEGNASKMVTASATIKDLVPPTTPTNVVVSVSAKNVAVMTWDPSTDNSGAVKYYMVYVDDDAQGVKVTTNSYTLSKPTQGSHSFKVAAFDESGNGSGLSEAATFFIKDIDAPTIGKITAVQKAGTSQVALTVTGFSDDSGAIAKYTFFVDGQKTEIPYTVDAGGTVSATYEFAADYIGSATIAVLAEDASGNQSGRAAVAIKVQDTQAPTVPGNLTFTDNGKQSVTLSWDASTDNSGAVKTYMVYVDGTASGQKATKNTLTLTKVAYGQHSYTVVATDAAGNSSAQSAACAFSAADTVAPTGGQIKAAQLEGESAVKLTVSGFTDDSGAIADYILYVNGEETTVAWQRDDAGNATATYRLDAAFAGEVKFSVAAKDSAGNISKSVSTTARITDTQAPTTPANLAATDNGKQSVTLSWEAATDNSGSIKSYTVYVDGNTAGTTTARNSITLTKLAYGQHSYTVAATDAAGNVSEKSASCEFTVVDTTAPTGGQLKAVQVKGESAVALTLSNFTDDSGVIADYILYVDDVETAIAWQTDKYGNPTATYRLDAAFVGNVEFGVAAKDAAGNIGKTVTSTVKVADTQAPTAPANLSAKDNGNQSVTLAWDAAKDNSGAIKTYKVFVDGSETGTVSAKNTITLTKLAYGEHSYTVTATDAAGNVSETSEVCAFTVADITAPTGGKVQAVQVKGDSAVNLTVSGFTDDSGVIADYILYVDDVETAIAWQTDKTGNITATYRPDAAFVGTVTFAVSAKDAAGNVSKAVSATVKVTDTQAPTTPENLAATDNGKHSVTLSWDAATDNSGVIKSYTVYVDGSKTGTTTAKNTVTLTKLAYGEHSYTVAATDAAGNVSEKSSSCGFTVADATAPTGGQIKAVQVKGESAVSLTVSGFTDDSGVIADYILYVDGEEKAIAWQADKSGNITATYQLDAAFVGDVKFGAAAKDAAGNTSKMVSATVKVTDTQAPTTPANLAATDNGKQSVTLSWDAATDNSGSIKSYTVYVDGSAAGTTTAKNSITLTKVAYGEHSYTVAATDAAGNVSGKSSSCQFTVADATAPTGGKLQATQVKGQSTVNLIVSGFSDDSGAIEDYVLYVDDVETAIAWQRDRTGKATATYQLDEAFVGSVTFAVSAKDTAGNMSKAVSATVKVTDTQAPTAPENLAAKDNGKQSVTLSWEAATDNSGSIKSYVVYVDGSKTGTTTARNTITLTKLAYGEHSYTVAAIDAAGNVSETSEICEFTVADTTAPTGGKLQATQVKGQSAVSLALTGFTDDSGAIEDYILYVDDQETSIAWQRDKAGNATAIYQLDEDFIGSVKFAAVAKDAAGNTGKVVSATVKVTDTQAPTAPTNLSATDNGKQSVTLSWDAATDNSGAIKSYVVYVDGSKTGTSTTNTSLTLTKVSYGEHSYKVVAIDGTNNISEASDVCDFAVVDVTSPTMGRITAKQAVKNGAVTLVASGFSDDSGALAGYVFTINGVEVELEQTATKTGVIGYYQPSESATLKFGVYAYDDAGNISKEAVTTLKVTGELATRGGCSELEGFDCAEEELVFADETAMGSIPLAWNGGDAAGCLTGCLETLSDNRNQMLGYLASLG